ncbi:MAG: hypothetical protein KC800_29925, partial [Candidatus Eremiobacteraeota bacterium]|nr:hypothetical protein [Candidatus Eremiobacteraeota bacterium]
MLTSHGNRRGFLLVMALLFAGLAAFYSSGTEGVGSTYRVSGLYRSELLDDEVSISALTALTYTEEFRKVVGGQVFLEAVPESPYHVRISTELSSEEKLQAAHKRAIHLLTLETRDQAMGTVKSSLTYLSEVRKKAANLKQQRISDETQISLTKETPKKDVLSTKDTQRVLFLRDEIGRVESYLEGGELPKTVRVRLDRESLNHSEEKVRAQQEELRRLAKVFHPSSKAVQAQRMSLEQAQSELDAVERQLAEVYLRSLKLELETLDDKASSRIQDSLTTKQAEKAGEAEAGASPTASSAWLDEREKELKERADVIDAAAALKLEGKLLYSEHQATPYSLLVACWSASLLFFLLGIFSPGAATISETVAPSKPEKPLPPTPPTPTARIKLELPTHIRGDQSPDQMERFFDELRDEVTDTLGRQPRRLLVLGEDLVESRLAFSISLA